MVKVLICCSGVTFSEFTLHLNSSLVNSAIQLISYDIISSRDMAKSCA